MPELIERMNLLNQLCEKCGGGCDDDKEKRCWKYKLIMEQPTITPEVRHGRWLSLEGWFNKSIVKCSVCGNTLNMDGVNAGRGDANFCPNCGARMDATDTNVGGKGGADK